MSEWIEWKGYVGAPLAPPPPGYAREVCLRDGIPLPGDHPRPRWGWSSGSTSSRDVVSYRDVAQPSPGYVTGAGTRAAAGVAFDQLARDMDQVPFKSADRRVIELLKAAQVANEALQAEFSIGHVNWHVAERAIDLLRDALKLLENK